MSLAVSSGAHKPRDVPLPVPPESLCALHTSFDFCCISGVHHIVECADAEMWQRERI